MVGGSLLSSLLWAQTQAPTMTSSESTDLNKKSEVTSLKNGDLTDYLKSRFEQLTPDEKQRLTEKFEKWKALPPEERAALIHHEKMRRERMQHEIEEALKKTGLQLNKERQDLFTLQYTQERRKIEEQLRKEIEEKRQSLLKEMTTRLTTEFATQR